MTTPEDALEVARAAAEAARAEGGYAEPAFSFSFQSAPRIRDARLMEWAVIEPELAYVGSTRRFGRPITLLKQGLLRLLRQYNDQVVAQQTRFNAHITGHVMSFDDRLDAIERLFGEREEARDRAIESRRREDFFGR